MQAWRQVGHNIVHLIYPIRRTDAHIEIPQQLVDHGWELMLQERAYRATAQAFYPSTYAVENEEEIIDYEQIISSFHPSVQGLLFHKNKSFRAFHKTMGHLRFTGRLTDEGDSVTFEWLSSEMYTFMKDTALLVVRLSVLENVASGETNRHSVLPMSVWMRFMNRIRHNYVNHADQTQFVITHIGGESLDLEQLFFYHLFDRLELANMRLNVSNIELDIEGEKQQKDRYLREPKAFVHAFIMGDFSQDLTDEELYQCIHLDRYPRESGGADAFMQLFIEEHVYRRWGNKNCYYMAIDYGTVTLINDAHTAYRGGPVAVKMEDFIAYQQHCRIYLLFVVLQLHYREELLELAGRYSRLQHIESEETDFILESYYNLNQHFVFHRVSNEIQGRELWTFYYQVFQLEPLYQAVQTDIEELNRRSEEVRDEKQERQINILTIVAAISGLFGMNLIIPLFEEELPASLENIPDALFQWTAWLLNWLVVIVIIAVMVYLAWVLVRMFVKWSYFVVKDYIVAPLLKVLKR